MTEDSPNTIKYIPLDIPEGLRLVFRRGRAPQAPEAEEGTQAPKVICLATGKAFKPPLPEARRKELAEAVVNDMLVEELSQLLQRARSGELMSMSYIALNRIDNRFEWHAIMAIGTEDSDQHAIRHLGALKMLEETLTDLVYAVGDDDEDDEGEWDDGYTG